MKKLEKESRVDSWILEVECTGDSYKKSNPCGKYWQVKSKDIVKAYSQPVGEPDVAIEIYGFICPECKCFTEIPYNNLPKVVMNNAHNIEKGYFETVKHQKKSWWRRIFNL